MEYSEEDFLMQIRNLSRADEDFAKLQSNVSIMGDMYKILYLNAYWTLPSVCS